MPSLDPVDDFAEVLLRRFLLLCENPRTRERMLKMVRGASGSARAGRRLYRLINRVVLHPVMGRTPVSASSIRWELAASQLVGIATLRYVVRLEPMASLPVDEVVAIAAPALATVLRKPAPSAWPDDDIDGERRPSSGLTFVIPVPVPKFRSLGE